MKFSIITVSYNSQSTIGGTIESVLSQTYSNVEYIVVDGASTDNTIDIIKSYGSRVTKFISEEDDGIYDAMNKGIRLATGDIVGILNSDDFYTSPDILEMVARGFEHKVDCVYGDLEYVDSINTSKTIRYWKSKKFEDGLFQKGWHPAHPTFFVKKECYLKYGFFNLEFSFAGDYEIMLRFLEKYKIKSQYINHTLVKMRIGGVSNNSFINILKSNVQSYKAWKVNNLSINPMIYMLKPLSKILQYIWHKNAKL